jgi:hypothetical protein
MQTKKRPRSPTSVSVGPETEFTDAHGVLKLFGIQRTFAYHLSKAGQIKSISLKHDGEKRGKRLYHVPSIRRFLESKMQIEQE